MATIDIIILAMIGVGVIMGLIKGFVKQMASIVGLIAGLLMARALFGIVAEIPKHGFVLGDFSLSLIHI